MQYFDLKLQRDNLKTIEVQTEGTPSLKVVLAYPTQVSTGLTAIRGKSKQSAKQAARKLGLC